MHHAAIDPQSNLDGIDEHIEGHKDGTKGGARKAASLVIDLSPEENQESVGRKEKESREVKEDC